MMSMCTWQTSTSAYSQHDLLTNELFCRFGNLIGDADPFDSDAESTHESIHDGTPEPKTSDSTAVARPTLSSVFGDNVEVLVETHDQQSADVPLVQPDPQHRRKAEHAVFTQLKKNIPDTTYDRDYMLHLLGLPERVRNVALVGALHSGKTSLADLLALEAHARLPHATRNVREGWKPLKYTDNTKLEIERGLSCKLNGLSVMATDLQDNSVALNVLDVPGHANFFDELAVALAACDCAVVVVDVVEGVTAVVQQVIRRVQQHGLPMVFVLNKIDRLILELKLPPRDAFLKLAHVVDEINAVTEQNFSPELGNVVFASAKLGFSFTIKEFVQRHYSRRLPRLHDPNEFVARLWGSVYFNGGRFSTQPTGKQPTTFEQFVLQPLYKLSTHSLSRQPADLADMLKKQFGVELTEDLFKSDPLPLLRHVLKLVFGNETGLVDSISLHCASAEEMTAPKLRHLSDRRGDGQHAVLAHVLKLLDYGGEDWALVRVYHGSLRPGDSLQILDEGYSPDAVDIDELPAVRIGELALMGGRYTLPVSEASRGQLVLAKGLADHFTKSATLVSPAAGSPSFFRRLDYINEPVFKIVVQPYKPSDLPKLLDGLNRVNKYYPGVTIKVEESGEHVILGSGELYLDCLLHDLRTRYAGVEVRTSDPLTTFAESCIGESFASIPATSSNGQVSLSVGAQPLQREMAQDLVEGNLGEDALENARQLAKRLRGEYGWDSLASRNVWGFCGANVFVNDTLPDEVDAETLQRVKQAVRQGFQWSAKEGPLAEEPLHGVCFKLLGVEASHASNSVQLIPLVRKACYIALMTATPVLLEPVYEVDVIVHGLLVPIVEELFAKRRSGRTYQNRKITATPLVEVKGRLPVIESIGFETDLRLATNGGAMCQLQFWNKTWRKVPGNVLDEEAYIPKLKPAPIASLSRDFVMKTRRRKGISSEGYMSNDGPSLAKYVEPELFAKLQERGLV